MIIVDATVLAYAVGDAHPLRDPCRGLLAAHADGRVEVTTTVEVIQEFAHIRARRRGRSDAVRLAGGFIAGFDLLVTTPAELIHGLELFAAHPAPGSFDAVLAAVAIDRGADALVSADSAFSAIRGMTVIDPATPAMSLIGD